MTKTDSSGAASQTGLSGAMTAVVYTANEGYYFPTDYSVTAVNGISVTRNSYTQITVSGTPTADAAITLTAPTAKTTPDAPTTAAAENCTTASNNDGKLTGVTNVMEYKKSDAENWTTGTGSDITGLVPGTYYVRVKATETTNASTNQELTIKGFISYTVTFKVVNGKWNEGEGDAATADKTVTLTGHDGDTLKLTADQILAVGTKPNDTYKVGNWDTTPSTDTAITADTTYTYTYAQKDSISQTVTFKVVNGKWDDETTADKTVTLTGYEGDTLKLAADQIPAVGTKPSDTYKAGSWNVTPSTETEITAATTYTYTYAAKEASVVTKAPEAKTLTYNGSAQGLVIAGEATGGEMQYALGTATEATQPYTTSIPTATNAGTYYVWYKAVGDDNHNNTNPDSVTVTINPASVTLTANSGTVTYTGEEQTVSGFTSSVEGLTFAETVIASGKGTNVGEYDVTFTGVKLNETKDTTGNYVVKETFGGKLTIVKANSAVKTAPTAENLTYTGKAQALVTAGEATDGEMQYALGADAATAPTEGWGTSVPTATDAGTYFVWYQVVGDENHDDVDAACVTATIEEAIQDTATGETEYQSSASDSGIKGISDDGGALNAQLAEIAKQDDTATQQGQQKEVNVKLNAASVAPESIPASEASAIQDEAETAYGGQAGGDLNLDYLDLSVEKIVVFSEGGVKTDTIKTELTELGSVVDISVKYDMTGKTDPVIIRVHDSKAQRFKKLDAKPTEPYTDGTFYVEGDGENAVIHIYSCFFSTYAIVTKPAESEPVKPEPEPVKPEYNPEIITVASLTATGTDRVKLSWIKVKGANYYDVYFGKEGGEPVLLESVGGHRKSLTIKNLEKGTTYVAYVQPWKQAGGEKTLLGNPSPVVYAVTNGSATEVNAKGVYVNNKRMTMMAGTEYTLNGYVKGGAKGKKLVERVAPLRFYSDNINVAEVAPDGTITAVGEGKCLIYTLSNNGMYKATKVMVIDGPTKIRFSKKSINMQAGSQTDITSLIKTSPNNITTPYTLTTDSETVATVDSNGIVTAVGPGRAIITVTTPNNKTAKLTIRVKGGSAVSKGMDAEPTLEIITEDTPEEQFPNEESAPSIEPEAGETTITLTE